jgi:hypothetical protein
MADLLIDVNATATAARCAGQGSLSDTDLAHIRSRYHGTVAQAGYEGALTARRPLSRPVHWCLNTSRCRWGTSVKGIAIAPRGGVKPAW